MATETSPSCPDCRDTGWVVENRAGREVAVRCRCRTQRRAGALLAACRIPPRYAGCTLENYDIEWDPGTPSLRQAHQAATNLVEAYPEVTQGLLFQGPSGIGKTHLAIAILRRLVSDHGVRGLYVNFLELVQSLQAAFDGGSRARDEVLSPVMDADVLVLDELGSGKISDWTMDLVYLIVNRRYMETRLTVVTTNYIDPARRESAENAPDLQVPPRGAAGVQETLSDRVGARVRSRLYEMCRSIDLRAGRYGGDYRRFRKLEEWRRG